MPVKNARMCFALLHHSAFFFDFATVREANHLKLIVLTHVTLAVHETVCHDSGSLASLLNNCVLDGTGDLSGDTLSGSLGLLGHASGLDIVALGVSGNLVATVLGDEGGEVLNSAGTAVLDGLTLAVGGEELDGRETLDLVGNVVGGGIDLGDGDLVGVGLEHLTQLLVLGSKGLAVTAPGGVELDQDILVGVHDNLVVVLGNNDGDGAVVLLGDGVGLDAGVDLAGNEFVEELADLLLGEVSALEGVLLVLRGVLDGESGPLADLEVEVTSVLTESRGVNGSKVDLALVLLGDRLKGGGKSLTLLGCLGENVGEGDTGL
jgi:hypothetical protein